MKLPRPLERLVSAMLHLLEHKRIHAFQVSFGGQTYYICARCSGLYLGVILGLSSVFPLLLLAPPALSLGDLPTSLLCLSLAAPALLDWTTQRLALRCSTNPIRFATGLLAGLSLAWYVAAPITIPLKLLILFAVLVFISGFSLIDRRRGEAE